MKRSDWSLATILIAGVLLLAGCSEEIKPNAQEITGNTFCALDGMLLLDYPGPKAQILKWTPLSRQLLVEFKVVPLRLLVTG